MVMPSTQPNEFVPDAASTPKENFDNGGLRLEEVVPKLAPNRNQQGDVVVEHNFWSDENLSVIARIEILYGIIAQKIPGHELSTSLMEVFCYFLELIPETDLASLAEYSRTIPVVAALLHHPILGPWAAKILSCYYTKKRLVPDWLVVDIMSTLRSANTRKSDKMTRDLRASLIALLFNLQPLRPDIISETLFASSIGNFPKYQQPFQDIINSRIPESSANRDEMNTRFSKMTYFQPQGKNYMGKIQKGRWFSAAALANPENFIQFWSNIRFPDNPKCWLEDSTLLNIYLLTPRSKYIAHDEEFLSFSADDGFNGPALRTVWSGENGTAEHGEDELAVDVNSGAAKALLTQAEFVRDHLHENLPSISQMVDLLLFDDTTPKDLIVPVIANVSVLFFGSISQNTNALTKACSQIQNWFLKFSGDLDFTLLLTGALHRMLDNFFEDFHRLYELERIIHPLNRKEAANRMFLHQETANNALSCDSIACSRVCGDMLNVIFLDLLGKDLSRSEGMLLWDAVVKIWEKLAHYCSKKTRVFTSSFLPHRGLLELGLLHREVVIRTRVRQVALVFVHECGCFPEHDEFRQVERLLRAYQSP